MAENVGDIEYVIKADTAQLLRADKQVRDITDGMEGGFNRADKAASSLTSSFGSLSRVATYLMAILSVQQVSQYADAWTTLNNKLANALRPSEQLVDVTERVFNITQQTRGSLDATASLYARLERATREYGTSADDLAKLTTIINQGFVVSGATAQEAENAIIQLSQGLASGALRGEEFNSVNEQGNRLIVALADSMGVGIGQMRQMAAAGKLTTDVVVNGLLSQGVTIGNEFANTTTTISQALQVAGNNITKFFGENSTVKTGTAIFNDAVISVSENIGALSAILTAAAAVMGSRYVGALTMATAAKVKAAVAARNQSAAEMQAAQAVANKAAADLRAAAVAKERALDEIRLAEMMKQTAVSAMNAAAAEQRLSAARVAAAGAVDNYNRALAENKAAQAGLSTGAGLVSRGLSLIGGPAGAAMLAASAILYFSQRAKEARDDANNLADSVNELSAKFQTMSHTELAATIGKLSQNLPTLSDAVADAQKEFNDATAAVQRQEREIANWGTNTTRGRQAAEALGGAQDKLAIATLVLERAQNRLSQTQNAINIGRATLNGTMRQGIDLLRRDGEEAGVAAGMMGKLGDMINFAAKAKEKFNSSSLMVERPKDVQDYLDKLQDQVTLQSELNDRKRAQLKAEQDIRKLYAGSANDEKSKQQMERDVALARERAAAEYDAQQAQQKGKKETKDATPEATKYANQQEAIAQKLANLKQQSELAAGSTSELSREQAVLAAQQSLGKGATLEQIALAGKYRGEIWDTANALKAQAAAEKLLPEARENASYKQDVQDLKTALDAKKISQQQYNQTSEVLEQQHQANLAKIRSQKAVSPMQSTMAEVDPVQRLANQHAQQLALIQQFEQQGVIAHDNALALKNAADTEYEQARIAAQWEIFRNQSQANELLASSLEGLQSGATNALTGLISGTQSLQEAFANIGTTILNSVVGSLVQMGIEWVKSQLMGQAAAAASLASTMAQATAAASAWAPAAMSASIATMGSAAAVGQTAYAESMVAAKGLALAGGRRYGGGVSAGNAYRINENGRSEIFQTAGGQQMFIPNQSGKVISADKAGGGGGVVQHITFEINTTGGIDDATMAKMAQMMKRVTLFHISDQANRPNGMIQPRTKR
ncbi:tape measure protein [Salmonella enterica subsp. enterica serovar Bovismorbificans]|uniref:tape measure protein n=1 Tax=Salmonella enterica TaxID=28901 RepID=UPI00092BC0B5|nr:tape measure protein [Salmonella enterica]EDW8093658.1 tape measure protein [Salmonella enterica subsp. enterica serovar Bovismorbificans]EIZ7998700.1 tape measure protein [Salmonella enterica subsp. enterica serovar Bovismorbificans]EJG2458279.1 tape measure protein [Salmonella enterica]EJK4685849.1 tape measure protein [Salmonella enterica]EJP2593000.1 tape measure protein [Salmonella enterica]